MAEKFLVYGHRGWIGSQFIEILKKDGNNYVLGEARCEPAPLYAELDAVKPTHVISFIGRTHGTIGDTVYGTIDYLEQPGKLTENVRDNLFAPLTLAIACKARGIHYTYLGTGCIFNSQYVDNDVPADDSGIPKDKLKAASSFNEDSLPNFTGSGYSTVKGYTDQLMHQFSDSVLNLRIRMPLVGEDNPRNFITKITKYAKICSFPNSMTVLPELLPVIRDLMLAKHLGTVNMTNPGTISHNEILAMYKKYVDPAFTWQNFSLEEQRRVLASDRSNNFLTTEVLEKFAPNVLPIGKSVEKLLQNYKRA